MTGAEVLGPAVLCGVGAVGLAVILVLVTPGDRRRGLSGLVGITLLVVGGTATAPDVVQTAALVGAGLAMLLGAVFCGGIRLPRRTVPLLGLLVVFAAVVGVVTQLVHPAGTLGFAKLMGVAVAGFLCAAGFTEPDRRCFVGGLLALAVAEASLGVVEFLVTQQPVPWGFRVRADGSTSVLRNAILPGGPLRVSGSLGHPIPFAAVCAVGVLVVLADGRARSPWVRWGVLVSCTVAVVLSGSRSVVLGLLLGAVVVVASTRGGVVVRVLGVLGGVVVGGIAFADTLVAATERLLGSGSYTNRVGSLDAVPGLLARSPAESVFGSGYGSDFDLYDRGFFPQDGFKVIDNQLVTTLGTEGVLGVGLLSALFVAGWARGGTFRRAALALFGVMLFSFDYFGWVSMLGILVVVMALPEPAAPPATHSRRSPPATYPRHARPATRLRHAPPATRPRHSPPAATRRPACRGTAVASTTDPDCP